MLIEEVVRAVLMLLKRLSVHNMKTSREDYDTSAGERTIDQPAQQAPKGVGDREEGKMGRGIGERERRLPSLFPFSLPPPPPLLRLPRRLTIDNQAEPRSQVLPPTRRENPGNEVESGLVHTYPDTLENGQSKKSVRVHTYIQYSFSVQL